MSKKAADRSRAERAAAAMVAQERAERRRNLLVAGAVVAVLALIVGVGFAISSQRDTTGDTPDAVPNGVDGFAVVVGEEDAPSTITLFEDLQCPVCQAFEEATGEQVAQAVEDGKVRVEYRPISILDQASTTNYSTRALNALLVVLDTSGTEAFVDYQRLLFQNQPAEGTAGLSDDELIDFAVQAGADEDAIREPIEDLIYSQWIKNATAQASKEGVTGTPTVLIDGESAGADPQASAQAVLELVG
jgi:protein-disulfide isomerase